MPALKVHGRIDPIPARPELSRGLPDDWIRPKHSAVLEAARGGDAPVRLEKVADDDLVELETQDGLRLWVRVDDLERDFGLTASRDAGDDALTLPTTLHVEGGGSRGGAEWAIKALKVFGVDIAGSIAQFVQRHVENRLEHGPGLFRCTPEGAGALVKPENVASGPPVLVFLHGTASSTAGSFGNLWEGASAPIHRLFSHYGGRVYTFEHPTLSQSPIQNAVEVAKRLTRLAGKGARLHLVSHSRGGLVGELLARGNRIGAAPFDKRDRDLFDDDHEKDRERLDELDKILSASELMVERFVRVACPARGTTLADERLDRYFSVLTNLVGMIPALKASAIYDGLTSLVAGVLKKRTEPRELPGLEAMMPGSPLVALLNRPDVQTRADLHVLGGDLEGTGVVGRLKAMATNFFYLEDHDLIVNTRSMFGGVGRAAKVKYWIDTGGNVTHFNYFKNPDTAGRVLAALQDPEKADYRVFKHKTTDEVSSDDYQKRAATPMPVVFLLPGIMGSNLSVNDELVWLDYLRLGRGDLDALTAAAKGVKATSLVGGSYKRLVAHLSQTHEVVPFPYDWRKSVEAAAEDLRKALAKAVISAEAARQPVRILAHSMGGLVVRAMLATDEGRNVWEQMGKHPGSRFVMLGTPNGGSHAIAALLMGRDALVKKLALLDVKHKHGALLEIIAKFDGVLNLLPHGGDLDLYDESAWQRIYERDTAERGLSPSTATSSKSAGFGWTVPAGAQLVAARAVRDRLRRSLIDATRMVYVAGTAPATPCAIRIDDAADAGRRVAVMATTRGDGRVPWATGIPRALTDAGRVYYMDAMHGDMADAEEHFAAVAEILTLGATSRLPQTPPGGREAVDEPFPLRSPEPEMLPDLDDLRAAAVGGTHRVRLPSESRKVQVRVVHANLVRAESPVLVGHYRDDLLVSAEKRLDEKLDRRLTELHIMDLYPGEPGTARVVLNEPKLGAHPGAIVVGLGVVGRLTPGSLLMTLTHGLAAYGAERVGIERRRRQHMLGDGAAPIVSAPVTTILIGSAEGGVSISDSLRTILRAVTQANARLRRPADEERAAGQARDETLSAFIDRVDIIELYEDRAIQAAKALRRLGDSAWIRDGFLLEERLVHGSGGEWRASYEEPPGWWQRIRITAPDKESLHFEASTQKARAPARLGKGHLRTVRTFLGGAVTRPETTATDTSLGYLLFDMLVPPEFKEYAPERQRLVLQVDKDAATLPWELLHDRHDQGARPLSVETGMIRQLVDEQPTERRREPLKSTALVIGNPRVSDPRFASLGGAEREARAVADRLRADGYDLVSLLGPEAGPRAVITNLHEKPWRILHIAAHGVFEFPAGDGPAVTGIVLDDGIYLSPEQLTQMAYVPELVFINCCHLGTTAGDTPGRRDHHLAANVATEFIRMGARAVVAAGWAVHDYAARDFAVRFYSEMLVGTAFGEAIQRAREETYDAYRGTNTWGAYQCYGDAGFMLRKGDARVDTRMAVDPRELVDQARSIAQQATVADAQYSEKLRVELDTLLETSRAEWRTDAALCAAAGAAYAELGEFEKALHYHREFMRAERAGGAVSALEQLANVAGRQAVETVSRKSGGALTDAERLLGALTAIGATAERHSLLGGVHKRRAIVAAGRTAKDRKARWRALERSVKSYHEAASVARQRSDVDVWFPLVNEIGVRIVLGWVTDRLPAATRKAIASDRAANRKAIVTGLAELEREVANVSPSASDFWPLSRSAERKLLVALSRQKLGPGVASDVTTEHRGAAQRGQSRRQRNSVLNQLKFFAKFAELELRDKKGESLVKDLNRVHDELASDGKKS